MHRTRRGFIVGFIALAAFIAACNGVTDEGGADPVSAQNVLSMPGPPESLALVVEVPDEVAEGEAVPMKMVLRNTGEAPIEIEMGQHHGVGGSTVVPIYNFFVIQDMDIVRFRLPLIVGWTGPIQTLEPNETLEFEWTWDQRDRDGDAVGSGTYQVIGALGVDAGPDIRTEPVSVSIR